MAEKRQDVLASLFRDTRRNAALGWGIVGLVVLVFVESALDFDILWMIFAAAVALVMVLPAVARRNHLVMLPWELLALAAAPVALRAIAPQFEVGVFAAYVSVAAFALLVVVELDMFTRMQVTHWFAVLLVVMTTLASAALWAILQWNLDRMLGTEFLVDNETLMQEWIYVTLAGVVAGVLFDRYFRRRDRQLRERLAATDERVAEIAAGDEPTAATERSEADR